jgi:hypothetical protein
MRGDDGLGGAGAGAGTTDGGGCDGVEGSTPPSDVWASVPDAGHANSTANIANFIPEKLPRMSQTIQENPLQPIFPKPDAGGK